MASASYHISNLLEKMTSSDKDFRYSSVPDGAGLLFGLCCGAELFVFSAGLGGKCCF